MMEIGVLGLNHRTAPIELREKVAFGASQLPVALAALRREDGIRECVILSTCNRVELYAVTGCADLSLGRLKDFLIRFHRLQPDWLEGRLYRHLAEDSVRHLFRVAAGMDSMVIGESEILGQVRQAYAQAVALDCVGPVCHRLFQMALRAGKEVRTRTRIAQGATSISSVAVELARRIFRNLSAKTILLLGGGKIGVATLTALKEKGVSSILIANRTMETAEELAKLFGGKVVPLWALEQALVDSDIVLCATSADHYLIDRGQVRRIMRMRRQRPLFFIDISVPRNLDPEMGRLENVYLYNIDDLKGIASANLNKRFKEIAMGEEIVEAHLNEFFSRWQDILHSHPATEAVVPQALVGIEGIER
jgi:glutamyl-tRNA reductase